MSRIVTCVSERRNQSPRTIRETISSVLQRYSSDASPKSYNGRHDLFYSVEGIGRGRWGLRAYPKRPDLSFLRDLRGDLARREAIRIVGDGLRRKGIKGRWTDLNKKAKSLMDDDPELRARAMAAAFKIVDMRLAPLNDLVF